MAVPLENLEVSVCCHWKKVWVGQRQNGWDLVPWTWEVEVQRNRFGGEVEQREVTARTDHVWGALQ